MAALVIAAANVAWVSGPKDDGQQAGEAFIAGAAVFLSSKDGKWYKGQADGAGGDGGTAADAAGASGYGMALFTADAAGARGSIARPGAIVSVGAGAAATTYYFHGTAGSLGLLADIVNPNLATAVAKGIGSNKLAILNDPSPATTVP